MNKKISIITINYNNLEGLKRTIESVIHQIGQELDYIIVDLRVFNNTLKRFKLRKSSSALRLIQEKRVNALMFLFAHLLSSFTNKASSIRIFFLKKVVAITIAFVYL